VDHLFKRLLEEVGPIPGRNDRLYSTIINPKMLEILSNETRSRTSLKNCENVTCLKIINQRGYSKNSLRLFFVYKGYFIVNLIQYVSLL